MLGFCKFATIKGAIINGKNIIINTITSGVWRPIAITHNMLAKTHYLSTTTTLNAMNTTTIESISTMPIIIIK
jgi:hypothetical protein